MKSDFYYTFIDNEYQLLSLKGLIKYHTDPDIMLWSARLSTGILGLTDCKSGNSGPKGYSEVLLAAGDDGLQKLADLGFITCPACRPETTENFWEVVKDNLDSKYGIKSLDDFLNRDLLPFDARRVDWEELLPIIGTAPNRLYVPQGLEDQELLDLRRRFDKPNLSLPPIGYYNPKVDGRFTEYKISSS